MKCTGPVNVRPAPAQHTDSGSGLAREENLANLVRLIATGGTIATTTHETLTAARLSPTDLLARAGITEDADTTVEVEEVSRVPSWSLDAIAMNEIALRARESAREPQVTGVVVTHGTSTLEFTAYFTDLIVDSDCPVIFTGAMRNADREDADGPRNLRDAIAIATADETRSFGAIVCFSGRVFGARDVRKNEREATDAFTGGQIGAVDDHGVVLWDRPVRPRLLSGRVEPRVALVKAYPGCNHNGVDAVVDAGALGVVLEGLAGSGGIPSKMQAGIRRAVKSGLPVVLSSRAPHGRIASPPTGGTGAPLRDLDLISAGDLAAEKAWVLLCAALGEGHDIEAVGQIFREVAEPDQAPSRPDTEDSSPKTRRAR